MKDLKGLSHCCCCYLFIVVVIICLFACSAAKGENLVTFILWKIHMTTTNQNTKWKFPSTIPDHSSFHSNSFQSSAGKWWERKTWESGLGCLPLNLHILLPENNFSDSTYKMQIRPTSWTMLWRETNELRWRKHLVQCLTEQMGFGF